MLIAPDLMGAPSLLPFMQVLPLAHIFFTSFVWPALFLLVVNGLTQLIAAGLIIRHHRFAPGAALACGVILIGWIIIQFAIFPRNPFSITYFFFGLIEAVMAALWLRHCHKVSAGKN